MTVQKKKTSSSSTTSSSMMEPLEGRQLYSASPALDAGVADMPLVDSGAGEIVATRTAPPPSLLKIRLTDILVSGYQLTAPTSDDATGGTFGTGKVAVQDISFTTKVSKSSPTLTASTSDDATTSPASSGGTFGTAKVTEQQSLNYTKIMF